MMCLSLDSAQCSAKSEIDLQPMAPKVRDPGLECFVSSLLAELPASHSSTDNGELDHMKHYETMLFSFGSFCGPLAVSVPFAAHSRVQPMDLMDSKDAQVAEGSCSSFLLPNVLFSPANCWQAQAIITHFLEIICGFRGRRNIQQQNTVQYMPWLPFKIRDRLGKVFSWTFILIPKAFPTLSRPLRSLAAWQWHSLWCLCRWLLMASDVLSSNVKDLAA